MSSESVIRRSGDFFFKYRNGLFPVIFASLFLVSRPRAIERFPQDLFAMGLGFLLVLAGQGFRLAVIGYAYIKRGGKEGQVYADDLVMRGFYAHSRNPMYVGNLAVVIGICILYGSRWAYFFVLPFFAFAYWAITVAEETYLRGRFGAQYEAYEKQVNRFWPNWKGLSESLKEFKYDWKRAVRKDYGNVFQNFSVALLILAWKFYAHSGTGVFYAVLPALAFLAVFYAWARVLKKSGQLVS